MNQTVRTVWASVKGSLWGLPMLMMLGGATLAIGALQIRLDTGQSGVWWLYGGSAKEAPEFLASLVSSMITMGTLAISITMVVLTLAAQQLGPRLIQSFMSDWRTQSALGLFLTTIVYLLLVLRAVYGDVNETGVPNIAVTIGTAFVLASVVVLLFFVHHLARSIVSDTVIERVGAALDGAIQRFLPDEPRGEGYQPPPALPPDAAPLSLRRGGYLQAIDHDALVACARVHDAVIALHHQAGDHILAHGTHGVVSPRSALTPDFLRKLEDSFVLGTERTPVQDLEFSIRQMVEVALRALSPGVNDPFTANAVIDRLALSIGHMMSRGPARSVWRDKSGAVRLIAPASNFEGILDIAFNQIRQLGQNQTAVLIRLLEKLEQLGALAAEDQRPAIAKHILMVVAAGRRTIDEDNDLRSLNDRTQRALAGLEPKVFADRRGSEALGSSGRSTVREEGATLDGTGLEHQARRQT